MKKGTRVKITGVEYPEDKYNPRDVEGTIVSVDGKMNPIIVLWDNGIRNSYHYKNLQLVFKEETNAEM